MTPAVTPPICQFCRAEMHPLEPDEKRDRLDQSGLLYLPCVSFECLTERCKARCIVTTVRIPGAAPELYPIAKES